MAARQAAGMTAEETAQSGLAAVALNLEAKGALAAAAATRALGSALEFLTGPAGIALMAVFTVASTAMAAMGQAAEEAKQKHQELFTEAQSNLENIESEKAA